MRALKAAVFAMVCVVFTGCASTNYSKNPNPATITEYWLRSAPATWEGVKVFRINDVEYGYVHDSNGETYTTDHGKTEIQVWFTGREATDSFGEMPKQTDLADLSATLEPNGEYHLDIAKDAGLIKISLVNTKTNITVASTNPLKTVRRRPVMDRTTVLPLPIPAK